MEEEEEEEEEGIGDLIVETEGTLAGGEVKEEEEETEEDVRLPLGVTTFLFFIVTLGSSSSFLFTAYVNEQLIIVV